MALSENSTALPLTTIVKFPGKKVQQVGLGRDGMAELQPLMSMDLVTFVRMTYPFGLSAWQWRMLEKLAATRGPDPDPVADPPLIVRATPEQKAALAEARVLWNERLSQDPTTWPTRPVSNPSHDSWAKARFIGVDLASGPDESASWLCEGETGWVPQRVVVDDLSERFTKGAADLEQTLDGMEAEARRILHIDGNPEFTPEQIARAKAEHAGQPPLKINRIEPSDGSAAFRARAEAHLGGPVGRIQMIPASMPPTSPTLLDALIAAARRKPATTASAVIGTFRTPPAGFPDRVYSRQERRWLTAKEIKERGLSFPPDPASPAAACTAHVTSAPATKNPEIRCTSCGWEGEVDDLPYRNPQDGESQMCPLCNRNASHCMETPEDSAAPTPSPLDTAIRGSASLDPGGDRKPAEQLLVETFDQAEARRKADAERIANMGRSPS
jgi:hypothetical protein